jgi:hypothetical protein
VIVALIAAQLVSQMADQIVCLPVPKEPVPSELLQEIRDAPEACDPWRTDCFIGLGGAAAGLAGPIARGLNSAFDFGEDVVRTVDWVGHVGAGGFTVGGFLNALFGRGG